MNCPLEGTRTDEVWRYIAKKCEAWDYPPTIREICRHFGWSSFSSAQHYLKKLDALGVIQRWPKQARGISLVVWPSDEG